MSTNEQSLLQLWGAAYAAFVGAFDTPQMRRQMHDDYSADARQRLREFNEAVRAALTAEQPQSDVQRDAERALRERVAELERALDDCIGDLEYLERAPDSAYARPDQSTLMNARAVMAKERT